MLVDLQGQIERTTYINEQNGFTIARMRPLGTSLNSLTYGLSSRISARVQGAR
jgi:hypothetical protein